MTQYNNVAADNRRHIVYMHGLRITCLACVDIHVVSYPNLFSAHKIFMAEIHGVITAKCSAYRATCDFSLEYLISLVR